MTGYALLWRTVKRTAPLLLALVLLTGCGRAAQDRSLSEPAAAESLAESLSAAEEPEEESLPGESAEARGAAAPYQPSELLGWQADPATVDPYWVVWEHLEYRLFGPVEDYADIEREFTFMHRDGTFHGDGPPINVAYRLPPICVTQENSLDIDLGFSGGRQLKIGELLLVYYELQPGEDPFAMPDGIFARDALIRSDWEEQVVEEVFTRENVIGGVWQTEKYLRGISGRKGERVTQYKPDGSIDRIVEFPPNHTVQYYVLLDETKLGICFFYVSSQADAEDLALYDAIAQSLHVVP